MFLRGLSRAASRSTRLPLSSSVATGSAAVIGVRCGTPAAVAFAVGSRSLHVGSVCMSTKYEFKAETRQLLDIVAKSLYSDKEVFIRELISNSSDALEKLKYMQSSGEPVVDGDKELAIHITVDPAKKQFIIQDSGIGMSKEELIDNLGTIARSGSKAFMSKLQAVQGEGAAVAKDSIIGQFGVGFYAGFMVGNRINVVSKSHGLESRPYTWVSEGAGDFDVSETVSETTRGTTITIDLKDDALDFANVETVKGIIKKYSNFVGFPIYVNGEQANTVRALWTLSPNEIKPEDHEQFYRMISGSFDKPRYTLHYRIDAPLNIRALLYVPEFLMERFGMGRTEHNVSLYSRKVLIKAKQDNILPEWLRFVRGVIDSEDVPLNISREFLKDSTILSKIKKVMTARMVKFLLDEAKARPDEYLKFYNDYSLFLKEGIVTDGDSKDDLFKLLRFDSSTMTDKNVTSITDYIARMGDREEIYYLCAPSRQLAEDSPYLESTKSSNAEVLYLYDPSDDVVMSQFQTYMGKKLVNLNIAQADAKPKAEETSRTGKMSLEDEVTFTYWLKDTLGPDRVKSVKGSSRLVSSPALISTTVSPSMQRYMKFNNKDFTILPVDLEINSGHSIVKKMFALRATRPDQAQLVAEQLFDNAMIAAGVMDEPRSMLPRLTKLLEIALDSSSTASSTADTTSTTTTSSSSPSSSASDKSIPDLSQKAGENTPKTSASGKIILP